MSETPKRRFVYLMDEKRRVMLEEYDGQEGYSASFVADCSGCTEIGDYGTRYGPSGCQECGYTGRRRVFFFVPLDPMTEGKDWRRCGKARATTAPASPAAP